ncbi:Las1-like-domain-containing protein [Trametes elegans]|nr:Las1-like-domain-containing protein [Trametes elegans]
MRLPRRVPWQDLAELEQVCGWIYADENDLDAKRLALNRYPPPHALESAHAILSVILQDGTAANSSSYLSLRMSYASAVIRLVNGLVDPLQLGAYARSINSIAQQLGLPAWLVELRHAATHEDLPSLEALRDAAREAMAWLLHNYFLPTLNPSTPSAAVAPPLRPLEPLLKQYKTLLKATTRDATLRVQYRAEIAKVTREVERWIAEAKVASASAVGGVGWDDDADDADDGDGDGDSEDAREKWALDRLCEALLQKGMLVPLSKKKRVIPGEATLALPRSTLLIWSPLLSHLQSLHPTLPLHIVSAIGVHLAHPVPSGPGFGSEAVPLVAEEPKGDPTYDICLASWAKWLIDNCASGESGDDRDTLEDIRERAIVRVVAALGPGSSGVGTQSSKAANALLQALSAERPKLATALSVLSQQPPAPSPQAWEDAALDVMDDRLATLLALSRNTPGTSDDDTPMADERAGAEPSEQPPPLPTGWRRLSARDGWRPAPIGVFVSCR